MKDLHFETFYDQKSRVILYFSIFSKITNFYVTNIYRYVLNIIFLKKISNTNKTYFTIVKVFKYQALILFLNCVIYIFIQDDSSAN